MTSIGEENRSSAYVINNNKGVGGGGGGLAHAVSRTGWNWMAVETRARVSLNHIGRHCCRGGGVNSMFMPLAGSFIHQTLDSNIYDTSRGFYYRAAEMMLVDVVIVVAVVVIIVITIISLIKASVSWSQSYLLLRAMSDQLMIRYVKTRFA